MRTRPDLRVCLGVDQFHPMGGTERQVVELAVELAARGIGVSVVSRWPLHRSNPYVAELRAEGISVEASGWLGGRGGHLARLPYAAARLRARSPEPLLVEAELWRWQARRVRRLAGGRFVLHELPYFGVVSAAGASVLRALDVPLVLTVLGRMEGVVPQVGLPGAVVTADGFPEVDPPDWPVSWIPSMGPRALASSRPDSGRPRTGTVTYGGRLVDGKGLEVLVRAMALVDAHELVLAGYGPEREPLERLARSVGVRARFPGPLDAAAFHDLLAGSDVVVFPAVEGEGLPSALVEALGAGTPVVASDVGAVRHALDGSGTVVPPGDPEALARALREVLDGPLEERRGAARRAYEDRFAPARVVDLYVERYEEALRR